MSRLSPPSALVFAYRTKGGPLRAILDIFRAWLAPSTFPCNLCRLTFTPLGLKKEWAEYLQMLRMPITFVHRDGLKRRFGISNIELPAVFRPVGDRLILMIDADEIDRCRDLKELIDLVDRYARP
jgi:hypothetical protein